MDPWLDTLIAPNPQAGFELAIKLARMGVRYTQPDVEQLQVGRQKYADDAGFLIAASQVIALHFQTIAQANRYWTLGQST